MLRLLNRQRRVMVSVSRLRTQVILKSGTVFYYLLARTVSIFFFFVDIYQINLLRDIVGVSSQDMGVMLVDDTQMTKISLKYRGKAVTTDVLSFPV